MVSNLYIHVPFCDGKCHYCGFYSVLADAHLSDLYIPLPAKELDLHIQRTPKLASAPIKTLYMGGGTPAILGETGLTQLIQELGRRLNLDTLEEWTVELNPSSITPRLLASLRKLGVNRLSIGVQCFDDDTLRRIGRRHNAEEAKRAVRMAIEAGFDNLGIDLIAGLPGVDPDLWLDTLRQAVALPLKHLSVYALSVEPGTVLARQKAAGLVVPDEAAQLAALTQAEKVLGATGFVRYEISNYAQPDYECRHNLSVWRGEDYLGLGPAAASRMGRERWTNEPDVASYIEALDQNTRPPSSLESLSDLDDAQERVLFALRLAEGLDLQEAACAFPCLHDHIAAWTARLEGLSQHGITECVGQRWRLTSRGRETCDAVIRELL